MSLRFGNQVPAGGGLIFADQSSFASGAGVIIGEGNLQTQPATVDGDGIRGVVDLGTLPEFGSQSAQVAGTGEVIHTGSGALQAQAAEVAGVGLVNDAIVGSGDLVAQSAAAAGSGFIGVGGTGTLLAQRAQVAGVGELVGEVFGAGNLLAQAAAVAGAGIRNVDGTGVLVSQASTVFGVGIVVQAAIDYVCYLTPYTFSLAYPDVTYHYEQQFTNRSSAPSYRAVDAKSLQHFVDGPAKDEVDYEFSNGRKFYRRP